MKLMEEEEFKGWLALPETQYIMRVLVKAKLDTLKDQWAHSHFVRASAEAAAQENARALGNVQALTWLMDLDYETLTTELQDVSESD